MADKTYHKLFGEPSEMIFTSENKKSYEEATECHIFRKRYANLNAYHHAHLENDDIANCEMCRINNNLKNMEFTMPIHHCHNEKENEGTCLLCKNNKRIKVRDHCHILHTYTGPAHQDCNLQYNIKAKS